MKKYAIFGNPVEHSISPIIHNAAFKGLGIDAEYIKILLENGDELKNTFLKHNLSGANVTVPHKEYAYAACDDHDEFAKKIGAVNTIVKKHSKLYGYNTDAPGFLKTIENYKNIINKVLILGAGGTAKAISTILKLNNYNVTILNRSAPRLESFKKENFQCYTFKNFSIIENKFDLIINTTSAGLNNSDIPAPKNILDKVVPNSTICIDVIYGRETPFLKLAKSYDKPTKDGLEMLLHQGVIAFMHFTNNKYDYTLVESYMREAIKEHDTSTAFYYSLGQRTLLRKTLISTICKSRKVCTHKDDYIKLADQYDKIGLFYIEGGRKYNKAHFYFNYALKTRKKILGETKIHIDLAKSYENLAVLYRLQGKYIDSEYYYQKTLTIAKKLNTDDDFIRNINNQLAVLYKEKGDLKKSNYYISLTNDTEIENLYMEAIKLNNLASLKKSEGQYKEAIELYNKALKLQKKFNDKETAHTASIYDNLAYVYKSLSEYEKALELYQKALIIRIDTIGENHEDTAFTYYNLATTLMNLKKYDRAEEYYQEALKIRENIHGDSLHPKIASLYESIGILSLLKSNSFNNKDNNKKNFRDKGKEFILKAINIRSKTLGDIHPDIASGYFTLASYFYTYEHNLEEALTYYKKALEIRQKIFDSDNHPDIASNYYHISLIYMEQKKCNNALESVQKAIDISNTLNYTHPLKHNFINILKTLKNLIKKEEKLPFKKKGKFCI